MVTLKKQKKTTFLNKIKSIQNHILKELVKNMSYVEINPKTGKLIKLGFILKNISNRW